MSLLFPFLLLFPGCIAYSQTATSGLVVGNVIDPSGAAVPNGNVQLLNTQTNATTTQATNTSGQFTFANVVPGTYKVTVTASGFRTSTVENLTVDVNKSVTVPVQLEVGGTNEVVEVSAAATNQLQTPRYRVAEHRSSAVPIT